MKLPFKIIAAFLLISGSANSQTSYPAKIEIDGDTVVAITISQMDTISARLIDCASVTLGDLLIDAQSEENGRCRSILFEQSEQIAELKANAADCEGLTNIQGQILKNKDLLIKDHKRKNRNNLLIGVPVSAGLGLAVGLLVGIFGRR